MAILRVFGLGPHTTTIATTDETLDKIAGLLEESGGDHAGFWLAGQLEVERNGEPSNPNPAYGHQRLWIPAGTLVGLVYDRPLHPDPDRIIDEPGTVYL